MTYPAFPPRRSPSDRMVTVETDIAAPMATVFEVLEDIQLFVRLEDGVRKVTITSEAKTGLGMKSHWEMYNPLTGAEWYVDEEFVHYEKPRQIAYVGDLVGGRRHAGVHNLSENPDGTVHLTFNEVFYIDVGEGIERRLAGLLANVKKEAESRAAAKG